MAGKAGRQVTATAAAGSMERGVWKMWHEVCHAPLQLFAVIRSGCCGRKQRRERCPVEAEVSTHAAHVPLVVRSCVRDQAASNSTQPGKEDEHAWVKMPQRRRRVCCVMA